ncbi:prepilin peptidase [Raoultibacter massiliensis]|uniref:Prepilin peptidase n=1 Tax=Raoultibacter massiliensis TaxID=1852371 RepID=A0ABV1JEK3_9ACTN|nr:A24 family peptidase [Raoultibacter massiliensis]
MSASLFDIAPALAAYLSILAAVLGACMGSFMNCLAWRLVAGESVLRGRSHCTACGAQLTAIDLIPIVSWFALRGRCRHCKGKISPRYVVVEIVMAAVFLSIALEYGFTVQALAYAVLACILCGVTLVDADTYTIPNGFVIAGLATWAATVWFMSVPSQGFGPGTIFAAQLGEGFLAVLADGVAGGVLLGGGILAFSLLFEQVTKRDSLGGGDVKLLFVAGLFLGLPLGLFSLLLACFIGLAIAFVLKLSGEPSDSDVHGESDDGSGELESFRTRAIPFGPAIAAATMLTLLIGSPCMEWYVGLLM